MLISWIHLKEYLCRFLQIALAGRNDDADAKNQRFRKLLTLAEDEISTVKNDLRSQPTDKVLIAEETTLVS